MEWSKETSLTLRRDTLSITHSSKMLKECKHFGPGTSATSQVVQYSYANLKLNENIFWICSCAYHHQIYFKTHTQSKKQLLWWLKATLPIGISVRSCLRQENGNKRKINCYYAVTMWTATEHDLAGKHIKCGENIFILVSRLEATIIKRGVGGRRNLSVCFSCWQFKGRQTQPNRAARDTPGDGSPHGVWGDSKIVSKRSIPTAG